MIREIINIDEKLCDGCGECVPNCHEGALQIIDGKARLVSELMCDGLGACIGHCPQGAMTIEKREAEAYDEKQVMLEMIPKGRNTIKAHLLHLKEHGENDYFKEGIGTLIDNKDDLGFDLNSLMREIHQTLQQNNSHSHGSGGGCPGSKQMSFNVKSPEENSSNETADALSALQQWPVQMHLVNPNAPYYRNSDVLIAADCTAFSMGNFHSKYLKGKSLAIACPKLDSGLDVYEEKILQMIDTAEVNTLTVMIMEVPCCGGLLQTVQNAVVKAERKVPVKLLVVGVQGEVKKEEWV